MEEFKHFGLRPGQLTMTTEFTNLVPRVLELFGQRVVFPGNRSQRKEPEDPDHKIEKLPP